MLREWERGEKASASRVKLMEKSLICDKMNVKMTGSGVKVCGESSVVYKETEDV